MSEHVAIFPRPLREIPVPGDRDDLAIVVFRDPVTPDALGMRHRCSSWPDDQEPDGLFVKVVAPRLSDHAVTGDEGALTVQPSILCRDCGLHGYITDGRWRSV